MFSFKITQTKKSPAEVECINSWPRMYLQYNSLHEGVKSKLFTRLSPIMSLFAQKNPPLTEVYKPRAENLTISMPKPTSMSTHQSLKMAPELLHPRTKPDDSQPTLDHLKDIIQKNKFMSTVDFFFQINIQ